MFKSLTKALLKIISGMVSSGSSRFILRYVICGIKEFGQAVKDFAQIKAKVSRIKKRVTIYIFRVMLMNKDHKRDTYFYQYFLTEWPKEKTLPKPNIFCLTPASCHDLKAFVLVAENMEFYENFADTAYANQSLQKLLKQKQQTDLI